MRKLLTGSLILLALALLIPQAPARAQAQLRYQVTIYNLTPNQIFSPPVVATHSDGTRVFAAGHGASPALRVVAEDGSPAMLQTALEGDDEVMSVAVAGGMVLPGDKVTLEVNARGQFDRLSAVGMLVTTNDAFFGLDSLDIDIDVLARGEAVVSVPAYDAGTEANNEDCDFIPGPPCGSAGVRATSGAEGFIHIHSGIHGIADLTPADQDWRNPVAKIVVKKLP